jgi:NADH dehydrogenase
MGSIVVVGGGFAGLNAAVSARRVAGSAAEVLLISREPWLTIRPRLYEANPETLRADLLETLNEVRVEFRAAEAIGFDLTAKTILLADQHSVKFDRLVVTTGSIMARPPVPGSDLAFSIDDYASAVRLDEHLRVVAKRERATIVVIGSGFTGLELALEMRDRLAAHGGQQAGEDATIILVDRQPVAAAELGEGPRIPIESALGEARIEIRLNSNIVELTSESVRFADGSSIKADAVILCTGLVASPLAGQLPAAKDEHGRLIPDQYLRVPELPFIFAGGDAVRAEVADGRFTLFSCQHSLQSGKFAGENAALDLLGHPIRPYKHERYVTCLDLGRSGAVFTEGWDRTLKLTGEEAKAVKRRINTQVIYPTRGTADEILAASKIL